VPKIRLAVETLVQDEQSPLQGQDLEFGDGIPEGGDILDAAGVGRVILGHAG